MSNTNESEQRSPNGSGQNYSVFQKALYGTRHDLNVMVAQFIVGIGAVGIPNSYLWMALDPQMEDLDTYTRILASLKGSGLITESSNFLSLTNRGIVMLTQLEQIAMESKGWQAPEGKK